MAVTRIVVNIAAERLDAAGAFYADILGMELVMDHGWIPTFAASGASATSQISVASQGGSDTPVPDLSIETDDLDDILRRVHSAGLPIEYGPTVEPWGVRRFYLRDPFGRLLNILTHSH